MGIIIFLKKGCERHQPIAIYGTHHFLVLLTKTKPSNQEQEANYCKYEIPVNI